MRYLILLAFYFANVAGFGQGMKFSVRKSARLQEQQTRRAEKKIEQRANRPAALNINDRENRLKAIKAAYMSAQLNLTNEQANKFWPVYHQYENELIDAQRQRRENARQPSSKEQIEKDMLLEQKIVDIRKRYTTEFVKVLPYEKVGLIFKSEQQFQQEMIKSLQERKNEVDN